MSNLTANRNVETRAADGGLGGVTSYAGTNAIVFYAGGFVCVDISTGLAVKAADTANYRFRGLCVRKVTADGATGDNEVQVITGPIILVKVAVTGVDNINDTGDRVYVTDDNVLTLTPTSNLNAIGVVERYYGSSTTCDVRMFSPAEHDALYAGV